MSYKKVFLPYWRAQLKSHDVPLNLFLIKEQKKGNKSERRNRRRGRVWNRKWLWVFPKPAAVQLSRISPTAHPRSLTQTASAAVQAVGATKGGVKSCPHDESGPEFVCVWIRACVKVCTSTSVWLFAALFCRRVSCACRGHPGVRRYVSVLS